MSIGMLILFVLYAAFAAYVHELIVGLAAMHSGWFPAFAVALITLIIGMLIGFPVPALALLVGFSAATGPAFADMGYDLKAGYILRGNGADPAFEREGRRQQLYAAMFAFVIAGVVVFFSYQTLLRPEPRGTGQPRLCGDDQRGRGAGRRLVALPLGHPGALLQFFGGLEASDRGAVRHGPPDQLPDGRLGRAGRHRWRGSPGSGCAGRKGEGDMEVFAAGVIAGDAIFSFFDSVTKNLTKTR